MKQVVQTLQLALEKEKTKVNDLKEQVGFLSNTQTYSLLSFLGLNAHCSFHFDLSNDFKESVI